MLQVYIDEKIYYQYLFDIQFSDHIFQFCQMYMAMKNE